MNNQQVTAVLDMVHELPWAMLAPVAMLPEQINRCLLRYVSRANTPGLQYQVRQDIQTIVAAYYADDPGFEPVINIEFSSSSINVSLE